MGTNYLTIKDAKRWCGASIRFEMVNVTDVNIDEAYQRIVAKSLVKIIVDSFIAECFDPPLIAVRKDETMWAVDGQTRITALKEKSISEFPARIIASDGRAHEAELFRKINKQRRGVKCSDVYRASLVAGDSATVEIDRLVQKVGLRVGYGSRWPNISAVSKLYDAYDDGVLPSVLSVVSKAWPQNKDALLEVPIGGLWQFFKRCPSAELERCISKWRKTGPSTLIQTADTAKLSGGSRYAAFAAALMNLYNLGLRSKRLEWS